MQPFPDLHYLYALDYARRDYEGANGDLATATPRLQKTGGSHAQRDLFVQTWLDTLFRTNRGGEAVAMLEARAKARPNVSYGFGLLADPGASLSGSI